MEDNKMIVGMIRMLVLLVAVVILALIGMNAFENHQKTSLGYVWVGQKCEPGSWVKR